MRVVLNMRDIKVANNIILPPYVAEEVEEKKKTIIENR